MEKNLIVEVRLKSGKRYTFETDAFKQGQLEQLIEDVEFRGSGYFAIDETLFVRWSEIESFEDMSHVEKTEPNETETSADKAKRISDIAFDLLSEKGFSPSKDELLVLAYKHL